MWISANSVLTLKKGNKKRKIDAARVVFSAHQCFQFNADDEETACLEKLGSHLLQQTGLAIWGDGALTVALLESNSSLVGHIEAVVTDDEASANLSRVAVVKPNEICDHKNICRVFLSETKTFSRMQMRALLPDGIEVIEPDVLTTIALDNIPDRAWTPIVNNIYPIDIPEIHFGHGQDMILIDCPARNLSLMPNGLGYVHNVLKKTSIKFQTFDLDIVTYHRFHLHRLFDEGSIISLPSGRQFPADPWQAEHYDWWQDEEVVKYFSPIIEEAAAAIIKARPKMLGLSIHQCNEAYSRELVNLVKEELPDITVIVGGFSCYNPELGIPEVFPEADYMCIGECELTVTPLVEALANDEKPKNMPGILSRYDDSDWSYIPGPMPHNLDHIEFPKYEWFDLDVYRNFNGYQLTPIIASRGCRWSRCTFCAERFFWRIRSAKNFVDELEWFIDQGCTVYMFNESDLNGMPERVLEICDEILRRDLHVKLTGQLRMHKKCDRDFFQKLSKAGFVSLRFGIDAFSKNTLKLQKKGYTVDTIRQNMKDCWEAGIFTEVNWVIGVPGETEEDVEEGIALMLEIRDYVGRLANINPLILVNGGVYWLEPENYNIKFQEPKEELYKKHPRFIPADKWHSEEPYIDAQVRKNMFEHIVISLHDAGFPVGAWAQRIIDDVKSGRDKARTGEGGGDDASGTYAEALPQMIRSISSYKMFHFEGDYYALPHALEDVDFSNEHISNISGVIRAESEGALVNKVEEAEQWADSRGQYDSQRTQRESGTYMRAGSLLGEKETEDVPVKPEIILYQSQFFAVEDGVAASMFESKGVRNIQGSKATDELLSAPTFSNTSRMRRLANKLPPSMRRSLLHGRNVAKGVRVGIRRLVTSQPAPVNEAVQWGEFQILHVVSKDAAPVEQGAFGDYNLIEFDGMYYAIPFGCPVDWQEDNISAIQGVLVGDRPKEIIERIRASIDFGAQADNERVDHIHSDEVIDSSPRLISSIDGYNIIFFEGWFYGISQSLGDIDLTEVDVMEMDGVIRDVSQDAVESEIYELSEE